jgi:thioredoxin 1
MSETSDRIEEIRAQKRDELQGTEDSGAKSAAPDEPIHVTGADHFEEITNDHDVVLVDFHAEWCGPCKMLEPTVAELAAETDAAVAKVDVDQHQSLAQSHRVQGVPTLLLFADGEVAERIVGVREKADLRRLIERAA